MQITSSNQNRVTQRLDFFFFLIGERDIGRDLGGGKRPRGGDGGKRLMGSPFLRMLGEILRLRERGAGERGRLLAAGDTELPLLEEALA